SRFANLHEVQRLAEACISRKYSRSAGFIGMLTAMDRPPGLRERKKQRTRETIARVAHELFVERGYHATTLPDIAEAADVSTRTIFAYFPSKEDILFSDFVLMKQALAQALAERPEGEEALVTVREFMVSRVAAGKSKLDEQI